MSSQESWQHDESLELVKICGPTEAEMLAEMLRNNGIESTLQGEIAATQLPATSDLDEVRVWVRPEDAETAHELVDAFFNPIGRDELPEKDSDLGVENPDEPGGFTV
jgi:hypothetical protein